VDAGIKEEAVQQASEPVDLKPIGETGQESKGEGSFFFVFGLGLLIYMSTLLYGQVVLGADYSANRSTHLPWAGTSSTRNRNFLSSAIRDQLVEEMNPDHNPQNNDVSDFLNGNVANPFQCFFTEVGAPASYCPASPVFNEPDSIYNNDEIPQLNLLRPHPQFDGSFEGLPLLAATSWYHSLQVRFQKPV